MSQKLFINFFKNNLESRLRFLFLLRSYSIGIVGYFKMKRISREEVSKVAQLARLKLNEEQIDNHAAQIEKILDYINQLEKIDTTNVPCTTRAIEVINNFRSDLNVTYKNREEILNLAPSREDDFFKVPKIIKD